MPGSPDIVPQSVRIGDVLCDDGAIVPRDSFRTSGKIAKGVVSYVDSTGIHGWAVALIRVDTADRNGYSNATWSPGDVYTYVHSLTNNTNYNVSGVDYNGYGNTLEIKRTAESVGTGNFSRNAPCAYRCYYYDHLTKKVRNEAKGWYLPAFGQLRVLYGNRWEVNKTLSKIGGQTLGDGWHVSSTEHGNGEDWCQHPCGSAHISGKTATRYHIVRPFISF
jgi:hypothetical protein